MIALLIAAAVSEVTIAPRYEPMFIRPAPYDYELRQVKPVEWTCKMRSSAGQDFDAVGRFDAPEVPKSRDHLITRNIALQLSGPLELSANGTSAMDGLDGRHWFEIQSPDVNYKVEMDYIAPGKTGYIKVLSSREKHSQKPTVWQPAALGFCVTTISSRVATSTERGK